MGVKQTRLSNPLQLGTGKYEVRIASLVVALLSSRGPFMENNTSNNEADDIFVNKDSYKKNSIIFLQSFYFTGRKDSSVYFHCDLFVCFESEKTTDPDCYQKTNDDCDKKETRKRRSAGK